MKPYPVDYQKWNRLPALFLWLCGGLLASAAITPIDPGEPQFHPRRLLVSPKPGATHAELGRLHTVRGGRLVRSLPQSGGLQVVELPEGADVRAAAMAYLKSGLVQFAEPDYIRRLAVTPNDPYYLSGALWNLHNTGQDGGKPDADIDAPEAWDLLTSAQNIVVAVLDTGIRASHEDLAANIWTNPITGGYGWNALNKTLYPADDEGHGTLVSGILGAVGNNGKGIAGVAWRVRIMACKCFNSQRLGYDSDIVESIEFARNNGAKIINASMGAYAFSHALSNAIFAARQQGIIFVAACGNDGQDIDATPYYPSGYAIDNIISVAFTTRDDSLGAQSNYGMENVHLAAPGASMYSTFFAANNSYLGGSFLMGTSLAAPQVSGALALAKARFPGESHTTTIRRVLDGVDRLPSLQGKCSTAGRLNLHKTLSPPISLAIAREGPDYLKVRITTGPNRLCTLQGSDDLATWSTVVQQNTSAEGTFEFSEPKQEGRVRFYRVTAAP